MIDYDGAVALLDEERPGWFNEIDTDILDMNNGSKCILGQLHRGSFWNGVSAMGLNHKACAEGPFSVVADRNKWIQIIADKKNEDSRPETPAIPLDRLAQCATMVDVQRLIDEYDTTPVTITLNRKDARAFVNDYTGSASALVWGAVRDAL